MKRSAFTLIELVVVVAIVGILAAIILPVFQRAPNHGGRNPACQSNLKQIDLAFKQYIQDAGEKFPPVAVARSGYWAGSLQPYLKNWQVFQCPSAPQHRLKTTDYFYNARLASVHEASVEFINASILMGDGSDDSPANYALLDLPEGWRTTEKSPALRHVKNQGANYAFADGHVKYLKPEKITSGAPQQDTFTFAIQ